MTDILLVSIVRNIVDGIVNEEVYFCQGASEFKTYGLTKILFSTCYTPGSKVEVRKELPLDLFGTIQITSTITKSGFRLLIDHQAKKPMIVVSTSVEIH